MFQTDLKIPDVLAGCRTSEEWKERRREILKIFAETEYGKRPDLDYKVFWRECVREEIEELNAVHIHSEITVETNLGRYTIPLAVFLPIREEKVPAAVLICSQHKEAVSMQVPPVMEGKSLPELKLMLGQMLKQFNIVMEDMSILAQMLPGGDAGVGMPVPVPLDMDHDYDNGHWPVREMMKRGMAMIGFYAGDAEKDDVGSYPSGLAKIFGSEQERKPDEWGVLAVWAFAASCVMDYVESMPEIDSSRVAVTGHSRCGKAALWCGANDERFNAVMPNGSGCCGAALSRGKTGENLASIQAFFPHWFATNFRQYAGKEDKLPYDQHCLLAVVAPRILHVGSGSNDDWADPQGEHRSTVLASEVWKLYEENEFPKEMPAENECVTVGSVGYHLRKGPHKLDTFDWVCLQEHMEV